jgi:hypothetical protein
MDVQPSKQVHAVPRYCRYAAYCLKAAEHNSDATAKLALLDIAQMWTMLAEEAEKKGEPARDPVGGPSRTRADQKA